MNQKFVKNLLPLFIGVVLVCIYFMPAFQGKVLQQNDAIQATAMQHEATEHREKTGESALWINNLFSGMPAFMVGVEYKNPIIGHLLVPFEATFKSPSSFAVYYFLGFYLLLIVMGCSPWLSAIGALLFTLSSNNIIILEAGHNTKARCIGFMPFIVAGVMLLFQRKYWLGAMLCAMFLFFQIKSNHPQITFYMFLMLGLYFTYQFIETYFNKQWKTFIIASSTFAIAIGLSVAANFAQLWVIYEYSKDTMRGGSELVAGNSTSTKNSKGLDKNYAFMWSYGKMESMTFLVPDIYGGASGGRLNDDSKVFKELVNAGVPESNASDFARSIPTYWGPKTFHGASTSGPVYLGAIVCFLFLLGIFLVQDRMRWWLFATALMSLIMAWGSNFSSINYFLFDHLPMYSKFRTPEMILVLCQFTFVVFAMMTLKKIVDGEVSKEELFKKLKITSIIMGAVLLMFALMPSIFLNFISGEDDGLKSQLIDSFGRGSGGASDAVKSVVDKILIALKGDREHMAQMDAFRSILFVIIAAGALWAFAKNKLNKNVVMIIIGLASIIDLWSLDFRYLNYDKYRDAADSETNFQPTAADEQILKDPALSYRVYYSPNPYNEATPSYFHKNIGGYNPAKLARYQDLIDSCLGKGNMQVFNMLNTKYFIGKGQNGQEMPQLNPSAMGNAWMVDTVQWVNSPREEIMALKSFNAHTTAIIDASKFKNSVSKNFFEKDSSAKISLTKNDMDVLEYSYNATKEQLVVFSEVFYADTKGKGWQAYLDDKPVEHFRVNYILRGIVVPAGNHKIVFKFEPKAFLQGQTISFIGSIALLLLTLAAIGMWWNEQRKLKPVVEEVKPLKSKK